MNMTVGINLALTGQNSAGGAAPTVTYYVDPAGSDANDGLSAATAWQTLGKVNATTIPPGAWVLFKGGSTFTGSLLLVATKHFGALGAVTKFGSYGTGAAIINTTAASDYGVYAVNPSYVTVDNIKFTGVGRTTSNASGAFLEVNQTGNVRLPGVTLSRVEVSGFGDCGILVWSNASDNSPSGFDDLLIQNCLVHDCCTTGNGIFLVANSYSLAANAAAFKRPVIDGCKVYDNPGGYASPTGHSGSGILIAECDSAVIQNCEAYNNGAGNTFATGPVGIWMYDCTNSTVQFCESHHNKSGTGTTDGGGFDIDGGCQGCKIQYCYSHDNYGSGYQLYQYSDATILPLSNNTIRYNISENDGTQASTTKGGILIGTAETRAAPGNAIYGNTIYSSVSSANGFYIFSNPNQFTTSYVANNIIYLTGVSSKMILSSTSTTPALRFVGNCYQAPTISIKWGATTYTSFATWRGAFTTQETVAAAAVYKNADPLLVGALPVGNTNGFNSALLGAYKTQAGSVCRNGGQNINALFGINIGTQDLFGNGLPQGGSYDIGCFEGL
ncbi:right-handed parallel beta-helix repeat-containing protein [Rhizobium leguminosarum]|uniref:right-handed parallel beta-helix repeat-containing protein n=1 Tax=Rhizobium leguminosarum TaxID=384 RepID=UPI001C98612B|nr:right-handed parallel beta-helix repeat-containing protein [Rhizobium leguminosarum]MBY5442117.1 right-handed parallel beta-helix repeat-containing protein [Rhizobium leguminosarum]